MADVPLISGALPTSDRDAGDSSETLPPETLEQRVERLRVERDVLRAEIEADKLVADVAAIRRLREAAATPPQGDLPALDDDALSNKGRAAQPTSSLRAASDTVTPTYSSRLKLREPTPFKEDNMKAARDFIRDLEIVFALLGSAYSLDREKVLYGVMFLVGDTYEQWHLNHSVMNLGDYTFEDFKTFVRDAVEDPANRVISVTLTYKRARQKDG